MSRGLMLRSELKPLTFDGNTTPICPNSAGWLRGTCPHNNTRWLHLSCKRRDCPVCGEIRRRRIAWRVEYGLQVLGNGAWFVGTWDYDVTKQQAVRTQQHFIRWLRRDRQIKLEYAAVWETHKSGRLHLNLILAPWPYINQATLSDKWQDFGGGRVVWIERIGTGITNEVTKRQYKLANYMAKFEQQVKSGRGINYSRAWPKPPVNQLQRIGHIHWTWISPAYDEATDIEYDISKGYFAEIMPGEYSEAGLPELCDCFQYAITRPTAVSTVERILSHRVGSSGGLDKQGRLV